MKKIIIDSSCPDEKRVAILDSSTLVGFDVENLQYPNEKGNIYHGIVRKIEPSIQAAFVEYKKDEYGFLSFSEIPIQYFNLPEDIKRSVIEGDKNFSFSINEVIDLDTKIYVQAIKEKRYNKNITLTGYIKIPSRYCVLTPFSKDCVISPQITDEDAINKLKGIIEKSIKLKDCGVIIRKYAEFAEERSIVADYKKISETWSGIKKSDDADLPKLLYSDAELSKRIIRENYNNEFDAVIVNDSALHQEIKKYVRESLHLKKVKILLHNGKKPIFDHFKIERQVLDLYKDRVELRNGGYLIISTTETLTAIDVNSGKMNKEMGIEETAYRTNLDATIEIARQLELRGISGIIVVDFIDMSNFKYIGQVEKALYEEFKKYRTRVQISQISRFGLVAISRQRTKNNLVELNTIQCTQCGGSGRMINSEWHANQIFRQILSNLNYKKFTINTTVSIATYLLNDRRGKILDLERSHNISIRVEISSNIAEPFILVTEDEVEEQKEEPMSAPDVVDQDVEKELPKDSNSWIASWLNLIYTL